jgi:hypothetical protein
VAEPKKHHFLPIFYQRGWCDPATGQLIEYSRPHGKVIARPVHPAATGYKPFLYTQEGQPAGKKQTIETDYMAPIVDEPAAEALRVLLGGNPSALTEKLRNAWTRFMCASLVRLPRSVNEIGDVFKDVLRQNLLDDIAAYDAMKEEGDPATPFEWLEKHHPHYLDDAAKQMVVRAVEIQGVGDIIINMKWSTLDMSASRHELLTSDMPHMRFCGLKDPRCAILFPLTPTKLFIATHDRKAEAHLLRQDRTKVVGWLNDNIVRVAERYVYGRTSGHLRFVENRLGLTPSRLLKSTEAAPAARAVV